MSVTIHPKRKDALTDAEIELWRAIPVAVAVDLVSDTTNHDGTHQVQRRRVADQ